MKRKCYTEAAYFLGLILLAVATAMMEKANFGMSMVVAPAYLIHLKLVKVLPFFSFGMAEYTLQAFLLVLMMLILRRFRLSYLLSFVTAVLYGFMLDGAIALFAPVPCASFAARMFFYLAGMVICALSISLLFHTYLPPEAYELFVKEVSGAFGLEIHRCKTAYDCISCAVSVALSFLFFGLWQFEGVKLGTVFCALINGWLISRWTHLIEKHFDFSDAFKLRHSRLFEG